MPELASPDLVGIARAALLEVTPEATIGDPSGQVEEGGATSVTFAANMAGYPGWHWTVAVSTLEGEEPSVLEVELMPGEGALLAPDWVPWSERLADYEAAQEALAVDETDDELEGTEPSDDDDDDSDDDDDESDDDLDDDSDDSDDSDDDDDDLGSDVLHGGDLDGVDIDELDSADSEDSEEDDDEDDLDDGDFDKNY
jgi:hypothetical protein